MARKSRKQTAAPMSAPSLYVHVALYIRLSVEDNKNPYHFKCGRFTVQASFSAEGATLEECIKGILR